MERYHSQELNEAVSLPSFTTLSACDIHNSLHVMSSLSGSRPVLTTCKGFSLAQNTSLPFYQYLTTHPEKSKRFAGAMQAFGEGPDISPASLVANFDWGALGTSTIVDVGGSSGSVSIAIAQTYPLLQFIVQDRPEVIKTAERTTMPSDIARRIQFMAHDFFTAQPISADLYLFRYIFHNWPDAHAIKILQQLVPALRPGARILIHDHLLPEPNTATLTQEREAR